MSTEIINFSHESEVIRQAIHSCAKRRIPAILTIEGMQFTGKSTLLDRAGEIAEENNCVISRIDCADYFDPHLILDYIADDIRNEIGPTCLSEYHKFSRRSVENSDVQINNAFFYGATVSVHTIHDRRGLQRHLTSQFFDDISKFTLGGTKISPFVVLIDSFEKATPETAIWINNDLIRNVIKSKNVVLLVGGIKAPVICRQHKKWHSSLILSGINLDDWIDFARERRSGFSLSHVKSSFEKSNGIPGLMLPLLNP